MSDLDLTQIIEDALTDVEMPADTLSAEAGDPTPTDPVEVAPEPSNEPTEAVSESVPADTTQIASPAKRELDEFEKKFGIQSQNANGRENRIPYSRVKKITENAVKDAKAEWGKGLETSHVPVQKYQEVEAKVRGYEERLTRIAEFEQIMGNDAPTFLTMLYQSLPAYRQILQPLFEAQPTQPVQPQSQPGDDMPQPDQTLTDGSKVYSMEGLKSLQLWTAAQARKEAIREVEARYKPIEEDYQKHQAVQRIMPQIEKQIADARTWPLFNESEAEIVDVLQKNPSFSLERAYQHVVWPKMTKSKDDLRAELLKEIKQTPRSTSVQASPVKAAAPTPVGPRSLEDVIADSIKGLK